MNRVFDSPRSLAGLVLEVRPPYFITKSPSSLTDKINDLRRTESIRLDDVIQEGIFRTATVDSRVRNGARPKTSIADGAYRHEVIATEIYACLETTGLEDTKTWEWFFRQRWRQGVNKHHRRKREMKFGFMRCSNHCTSEL